MMSVLIRTARPVSEVGICFGKKVSAIDPELRSSGGDMEGVISGLVSNRRGILLLLGALPDIALLLSAVGNLGMLAYDVSRRTREIGSAAPLGPRARKSLR